MVRDSRFRGNDDTITVPAYAKVNLFLDVVGKRPGGYHELITLFERVDLADEVQLELVSGGEISLLCDHPDLPRDGTNLAVRAAELYRQAARWPVGIRMTLKKRIPVAAGLGGGSSDAAATLRGLQRLSPHPLSEDQLVGLARQLGSDVPFFLGDVPWALGRGRGDILEPLSFPTTLWHLLVYPNVSISTRTVYEAFAPRTGPSTSSGDPLRTGLTALRPDVTLFHHALRDGQVRKAQDLLFNALEPTVEALYPVVREVKATIQAVTRLSRPMVSGSGSTVMALCLSRQEAEAAAEQLREKNLGWRLWAAATKG